MTPNANNIYFFKGLRRLMPTPYRYVIPALWWLKGEEKPIENIVPEIIINKTKDKRTTPALNQTSLL